MIERSSSSNHTLFTSQVVEILSQKYSSAEVKNSYQQPQLTLGDEGCRPTARKGRLLIVSSGAMSKGVDLFKRLIFADFGRLG